MIVTYIVDYQFKYSCPELKNADKGTSCGDIPNLYKLGKKTKIQISSETTLEKCNDKCNHFSAKHGYSGCCEYHTPSKCFWSFSNYLRKDSSSKQVMLCSEGYKLILSLTEI